MSAVLTGCGESDTATEATSTTAATTSSTTEAATSTTVESAPTTTTTTGIVPPTAPLPDDELPGTAFELAPVEGAVLAVVGVRYDDVLNVRAAPTADEAIVAELAPVAADFVATGRARLLTQAIWFEVTTADGIYGWVASRFTARIGPTFDVTSDVIDRLGATPTADTMLELGEIVADALRSSDPTITPQIVPVVGPTVGDLGEVTYDVVGLGEDAAVGVRAHVFGQPGEGGEGFTLKSVEATDMCSPVRGALTIDELCV